MDYKNKLDIILDFARLISEETNLDYLLDEVCDFSKNLINAQRASLYIYEESTNELWTKVAKGVSKEIRFDASKGIAGYAATKKEAQIVLDPYNDRRFNRNIDKETGFITEQIIAIPLLDSHKNCVGVLQVLNKNSGKFSESDLQYLSIIATYTSMVIKNALLIELETTLMQQSKMAEMGSMLDNILHQWKQPLSVISMVSNFNEVLYSDENLDINELIKNNEQINKQVKFMLETSDNFRNFFSLNKEKKEFSVNITVENVLNILLHKTKEFNVNIVKDFEKDDALIYGYENDFAQVILSIINNALDKFSKNTDNKIFIKIKNIDDELFLNISDNAGEIPSELLPTKLFNRHVTTKETGTGLGLSICKIVINRHFNGDIKAYNENSNACFEIRI